MMEDEGNKDGLVKGVKLMLLLALSYFLQCSESSPLSSLHTTGFKLGSNAGESVGRSRLSVTPGLMLKRPWTSHRSPAVVPSHKCHHYTSLSRHACNVQLDW